MRTSAVKAYSLPLCTTRTERTVAVNISQDDPEDVLEAVPLTWLDINAWTKLVWANVRFFDPLQRGGRTQ
jgi:hypothetical protein